jgi:hypothetical protein
MINPYDAEMAPSVQPDSSVNVSQPASVSLTIHHDQHWGGGYQAVVIPAGTFSATVHFKDWQDQTHTLLNFTFEDFQGHLPSFASVALNGGMTGDNSFGLLGGSGGTINVVTGDFDAQLLVGFKNAISRNVPAGVGVQMHGKFDAATRTLSVYRSGKHATKVFAGSPGGMCEPTE